MKKFTVRTETIQFNVKKFSNAEEAYFAEDDHDDKTIAMCDTLEEARAILTGIKVSTHQYVSSDIAIATVAFIEEAEWEQDEDGEWEFIDGSDICDFTYLELPAKGDNE